MRIVVITGLSGSGKSTAVHALEDEGFFCIDNLPVSLIPMFVDLVKNSREGVSDVALVMDIRGRDFFKGYDPVIQQIRQAGNRVDVMFFDSTDDVLIRRFSETRRRHPLSAGGTVSDGIRAEREQLEGLRHLASMVIDTSEMNVHQLRETVIASVKGETEAQAMMVNVQSFGFRFGIPLESDLVFDVRFLSNPHFVPALKPYTGLDRNVSNYVIEKPETAEFLQKLKEMLQFMLPLYQKEGKSYLTISIGCTGGKHRSVAIVEELREYVEQCGMRVRLTHRDIEKG
jgi:UPF0042 nucleotide-binding protein